MSLGSPRDWGRDVTFTLLLTTALGVGLTLGLLIFFARDWAETRWPLFGHVMLGAFVIVLCVRIVRELVTPARSRKRSDVVAAGLVVAVGLGVLYIAVVGPIIEEHRRDAAFEARVVELRARADDLEAIYGDLPDPATATVDDVEIAVRRATEPIQRLPKIEFDELRSYTPKQRGEVLHELTRGTEASRNVTDRLSALLAALKAKKA
jgi:hypothetical protein